MSELLLEKISHEELLSWLQGFYKYAKKRLKIDRDPRIFLQNDVSNADDFLGKTGYYDPEEEKVVLYINDRHPKDIVRSFAHELIHHVQKISGMTKNINLASTGNDPAYALHDKELRRMEKQAFLWGNMIFRDWTDKQKMKRTTIMAEMTKPQIKSAHKAAKKMMPSMKKQYGKRGEEVAYATAAKMKKAGKIEEMDEASKPDFLDLDKDGNKKEPMKLAAKQAKKPMKEEEKMKLKVKEAKVEKDETEEISDFRPSGSRLSADEPDPTLHGSSDVTAEPEELDIDGGEEDEKLGGGLPLDLNKVEDKFEGMDATQQNRFLAFLAKKAKDKKAAARELDKQLRAEEEEARRASFASLPGAKPPMEEQQLQESNKNPYPVLFEQRERLLNEAFKTKEERVYNELVKRFIKK